MSETGDEVLPPLYGAWMADLLGGDIPPEIHATCSDCAMSPASGTRPRPGDSHFDAMIKCCGYVPDLPNFLVGRILADSASEVGRESVRARISVGDGVTPLGLAQPRRYALLYRHGRAAFGQSRSLRCPHFLEEGGGRCAIWRHREATCTTWFCKHVRGQVGMDFWRGALHPLLSHIQRELAWWCLVQLDLPDDVIRRLAGRSPGTPRDPELDRTALDGVVDREAARALWGPWEGREAELYETCARLVDSPSWSKVAEICGAETSAWARVARDAYRRLVSSEVPERLVADSFDVRMEGPDSVHIWSYSRHDPLEIPRALLDVLHRFDGRPTEEVLKTIAEEDGMEIDAGLVRTLADFGVLRADDIFRPKHGVLEAQNEDGPAPS